MDDQLGFPPDDTTTADDGPGAHRAVPERPSIGRPTSDPTEGVRIIGADEAAEAMERGNVVPRRGGDQPRFGDRPAPPPTGPRPALRFPLDASADPTRIERPPVQPAPEPVTGPVEMPHWTEPPTGEVPQVLIGDDAPLLEESGDDLDAWSSFATSAPRWRDADDAWDEDHGEYVAGLALDDESRVGALEDPDARPTHEEFFSFHDLEEQVGERTSGATRVTGHADADVGASADDDDDADIDVDVSPDIGPDADVEAEPARAALPDGDDFHEADDGPEPVGADEDWVSAGSPAPQSVRIGAGSHASGVFDDPFEDDDGAGGHWDEPAEEAGGGGASRLGRRKAPRQANPVYGDGAGGGGGRDLGSAVLVGVLLLAVFAGLMYIGPGWAMVLVAAVVFLAAVELFNALRRAGFEAATLLGLAGCVLFPLAVYWRGLSAFPLLIVLAVVGCLAWFLAGAGGPDARVVEGVGTTLFGIAWLGALGSFAAAMLRAPDGRALLLIAVLATVGYDVGGFFIGRSAGQRHLSDASPNKTVEGLLGGMAVCVVVTVIVVGALKLGPWDGYGPALFLGIVAALAAPLGDLCQSLVKRDLGVKDMSTILPGHGGIFDRFDALLFVLPAIYYAVTIVGHRI